jgi:hypothetical protein
VVISPLFLGSEDGVGEAGGAEAVVDVDDSDVGGTGVEHSQEGGHAAEGRAITNAGGDGDDGDADQAGNDGGEGSFHAGANDDCAGLGEFFLLGQNTV